MIDMTLGGDRPKTFDCKEDNNNGSVDGGERGDRMTFVVPVRAS
jgi:hypothetical protein